MSRNENLLQRALHQLTDLKDIEERFQDPDTGYESIRLESSIGEAIEPIHNERRILLNAGAKAVRKLRKHGGNAKLNQHEETGLEAIILLTGRPAILIQNGSFMAPPPEWVILETKRADIELLIPSVGRIELKGHPEMDWVGTGFLVGDDVVMTNRHVAVTFSRVGANGEWFFEPGIKSSIDFNKEHGAINTAEFRFTEVIGIHSNYDLALLRVSKRAPRKAKFPNPLQIDASGVGERGDKVFIVGFPASDSRRNTPQVMQRIFSDIYNVKRLQPGELMAVSATKVQLQHDCSTLGGNSGSCVVDLESGKVIGLHFGGRYSEVNSAVMLSKLQKDPLIRMANLNFA